MCVDRLTFDSPCWFFCPFQLTRSNFWNLTLVTTDEDDDDYQAPVSPPPSGPPPPDDDDDDDGGRVAAGAATEVEDESSDEEGVEEQPRRAPEIPPIYVIPSSNFSFRVQCDLDSVSFLSTSISDIGWFFRPSSVFELNTFIQRTKSNKHSKFRVCENPDINFRTTFCGQPAKSVPLESYPNIMLGQVTQHVPFSIYLYFVGYGGANKSNFLTNEQLQVLTAVMNASARLVDKTGLSSNEPFNLIERAKYQEEMQFMSFVADDGKKSTQSQLKNVKKQLSGAVRKLFLTAMSNVFHEIRDKSPEQWSQRYNVAAYVLSGVQRTSIPEGNFRTIASDLLECCVIVAESVGTKHSGITKCYGKVFESDCVEDMHRWMQAAVVKCHREFETKMFPERQEPSYPSQCWHRLDYAFQLFPCRNDLSFVPLLKESQRFTRLCSSLSRSDARERLMPDPNTRKFICRTKPQTHYCITKPYHRVLLPTRSCLQVSPSVSGVPRTFSSQ